VVEYRQEDMSRPKTSSIIKIGKCGTIKVIRE
ncbi:MAG: translation factor Sua5, partial [Bacteroidaceae bacterium]